MIESPKRQDPERNVTSGKHARNGTHAAISTADDDGIEFPIDDLLPGSLSRTPLDDPRQKTDWPNTKQTDKPWKGNPEKEQLDPNRPDIDLEKWHKSNTH